MLVYFQYIQGTGQQFMAAISLGLKQFATSRHDLQLPVIKTL